jgi:hypothetical protein
MKFRHHRGMLEESMATVVEVANRQELAAEINRNRERIFPPVESVPGADAHYVVELNTFRCVFSFTQIGPPGTLYRHLSVSIPGEKYPGPLAFYTIAELFGFTGWDGESEEPAKDWLLDLNRDEHCLVLAQKISPE